MWKNEIITMILFSPNTDTVTCMSGMRTVQKEHLHVHIIASVTVHKYCATAWKYKQAIGLKYY